MMWSKAELENLALGGAEVAAERVMKHLSRPENADIFAAENFSYLWGALGVAGLRGTDAAARRKIWQVLKENGVPDAFEKGILGDFTRELAARHKDNRLRAWHGLDNFQAGIKFQKTILEKLAKYDKELEEDVLPYCFDYKKLIDELNVKELGGRLKAYLTVTRAGGGLRDFGRRGNGCLRKAGGAAPAVRCGGLYAAAVKRSRKRLFVPLSA